MYWLGLGVGVTTCKMDRQFIIVSEVIFYMYYIRSASHCFGVINNTCSSVTFIILLFCER